LIRSIAIDHQLVARLAIPSDGERLFCMPIFPGQAIPNYLSCMPYSYDDILPFKESGTPLKIALTADQASKDREADCSMAL